MLGLGLALIISWLTSAGRYQFEAIYLNQLGAGESVIGLINTVGAIIELPAMLWADRLVRRYGARSVFQGSFLLEALAMGFVLIWPSVITMFAMRLVAGIAYSLYVIGMTLFITERAPNGQSTTLLALYSVTLRSLVGLASGPLSGLAFDAWGAYWLFAIALGGCLLTWGTLQVSQLGTSPPSAAS
jgi:PPP family 3-phenylpropionic acid transporter